MERLQALSPMPLKVFWHENKSTYLSVRKDRGHLHFRLHRLFSEAPTPVLEALIQFALKNNDQARLVIRQMIDLYFSQKKIEPQPIASHGNVYNLLEIFERIRTYLPIPDTSIGWSRQVRFGKFRSITFGTYDRTLRQIRINPLLDDEEVPLYFLEFIVYHEMLHAVCPSHLDPRGRCIVHTREFRQRERMFPQFVEAKKWEKTSLNFFKKRKRSYGRS